MGWELRKISGGISCVECDRLDAARVRLEASARRPNREYQSSMHRDSACPRGPMGEAAGCSVCIEYSRTGTVAEMASDDWFEHARRHPYEWHLGHNGGRYDNATYPTLARAEAALEAREISEAAEAVRLEALRPQLVAAIDGLIAAYANQDSGTRRAIAYFAQSKSHCNLSGIEYVIKSLTEQAVWRTERDVELRARGVRKQFNLEELFARDGHGCNLCGVAVAVRPVIDHVVPWAFGGFDGWVNLQVACRKCNSAKSCYWAGSLDDARLAAALVASPTYDGPVLNRPELGSWVGRQLFLRHLRDRGDAPVEIGP